MSHAARGNGYVKDINWDDPRSKPVYVAFDNGETHHYSTHSAQAKLQPTDEVKPDGSVLLNRFKSAVESSLTGCAPRIVEGGTVVNLHEPITLTQHWPRKCQRLTAERTMTRNHSGELHFELRLMTETAAKLSITILSAHGLDSAGRGGQHHIVARVGDAEAQHMTVECMQAPELNKKK